MARKVLLLSSLLTLFLAFTLTSPSSSYAQGSCTNTLTQPAGQSFWVGPVTSSNQNGAVIVLVHGYSSSHDTWTGDNYTVRDACNQGFRVAAVDLGGTSSIAANGASLATKINSIRSYYGVNKVNIMAHSKGGLDSQNAIVFNGAYQYVSRYIAFGTPFGGTDLADHACSWYGSWVWQCNDATRDMRTGNMSYVRSITDPRPENNSVVAFAARGSKCDWYNPACALISGSDDGVVPTWSVWASGVDTHISDRSDLRHGEVHQTQRYDVPWLYSYLSRATLQDDAAVDGAARNTVPQAQSNYLLRAGAMPNGRASDTFPVEGGLTTLDLAVITSGGSTVVAVSPSGQRYDLSSEATAADAILNGVNHTLRISRPEAGQWRVDVTGAAGAVNSGYYLRAAFDGGITTRLNSDLRTVYQPGAGFKVSVTVNGQSRDVAVSTTLRTQDLTVTSVSRGTGNEALSLPTADGVYSLELTITGNTADGLPFERTIVTSIPVMRSGSTPSLQPAR